MNIVLEDITEKNVGEITGIYNHYVLNTTASYAIEPVTVGGFLDYYKINDKKTLSKAIIADGVIAGFCLFKPFDAKKEAFDHVREYTVYISPDYCGKGVGKRVYNMMEKYLPEMGTTVVLAVVCAENTASCRMFESVGFSLSGTLRNVGIKFGRYLDLRYYQKDYR